MRAIIACGRQNFRVYVWWRSLGFDCQGPLVELQKYLLDLDMGVLDDDWWLPSFMYTHSVLIHVDLYCTCYFLLLVYYTHIFHVSALTEIAVIPH